MSLLRKRPDNTPDKEQAELILLFKSSTKENNNYILLLGTLPLYWTLLLKSSTLQPTQFFLTSS